MVCWRGKGGETLNNASMSLFFRRFSLGRGERVFSEREKKTTPLESPALSLSPSPVQLSKLFFFPPPLLRLVEEAPTLAKV